MTDRERISAVFKREKIDRIPWFPRLEMWYTANLKNGTLPAKYRGWDIRSIYRDQKIGFHGQWGNAYRIRVEGIETVTRKRGRETRIETVTPVGSVWRLYKNSPELESQGLDPMQVEHPITGPDDYPVMEWIYEHTEVEPAHEEFSAFDKSIDMALQKATLISIALPNGTLFFCIFTLPAVIVLSVVNGNRLNPHFI